ncbi:MAG: hypothetical protein ABSA80_06120 [Terriglobales bacterium]|jgi:hypothetical protein
MNKADLDQLRAAYKTAVDEWVDAIRAEELGVALDFGRRSGLPLR